MINDVPVDWKGFKIPKKSTNQNPNITKNQVCLSVILSLFICIDYHSLLSCDFNDDWHSALTENRARWPGEHTGKLSGERRMEQTQKSDTSASNREVKVSQATFFRKENTQEISWKEGKDL